MNLASGLYKSGTCGLRLFPTGCGVWILFLHCSESLLCISLSWGPCEVSLPPSRTGVIRQCFLPKVKHLVIDQGRTKACFSDRVLLEVLLPSCPCLSFIELPYPTSPRRLCWPTEGPSAVCSILLKRACCLHLSVAWLFNHSLVYLTFQLCTYILHKKIINKVSGISFIIPALFPLLPPPPQQNPIKSGGDI